MTRLAGTARITIVSVLVALTACASAPRGRNPELVVSYRNYRPSSTLPITIQLQGFERRELRPVAFTRSYAYGHAYGPAGSASGSAIGRSVSYGIVESTQDRDLVRVMLENMRIVERVVTNGYEGEIDFILRGDLEHNVLNGSSKVMAGFMGITLIILFGVPVYESADGYARIRVYDGTDRFIREYRASETATRWKSYGATWIIAPQNIIVGPTAATFALAGVLAELADDLERGALRVSAGPR